MARTPSIFDVVSQVKDTDTCIAYLQSLSLLKSHHQCSECCIPMIMVRASCTKDGKRWLCTVCKKTASLRTGSVFQVSIQLCAV